MKPIIKPKDHLRKKRHRKQGDVAKNVVEEIAKKQRKEKETRKTK